MGDIEWIKITTDMFDNRKIKHLRRLPDGDSIVLIWVMLLTMAGRCNAGGMIFLTENIPYTSKLLADELNFEETTVQLALNAFEELGMVVTDNGFFTIAGWSEYQNIEGMEKIREQNRIRKQRQRQNEKLICINSHVTSRDSHATEEDKEEDKNKNIYKSIADLYNQLCPSLPSIKSLSDSRKKAIKARLNHYSIEDFEQLFKKAESSDFLKGGNERNWTANFDWLIKDANMAKVLDGNYENKKPKANKFNNFENHRNYDFDALEQELLRKGRND